MAPRTQQTKRAEVDQDVGYYVYAIVPADLPVPPLGGLDDVEVELIALDDLAAVVSRFALDRPPGRKAELVAHSRVVDALAEATNRLDLYEEGGKDLSEFIGDLQDKGASKKVGGAIKGAKKALTGGDDDDEERPRKRSSSSRKR